MFVIRDINILFSLVNTKLRDEYSSFDELCEEEGEDKDALMLAFNNAGFIYDETKNTFKAV